MCGASYKAAYVVLNTYSSMYSISSSRDLMRGNAVIHVRHKLLKITYAYLYTVPESTGKTNFFVEIWV